jgi:hypothetical protein
MTLHALNPPGDWDVVIDAENGKSCGLGTCARHA